MPVNITDLIDLLAEICEQKNLKASLKESGKGALMAGISAGLGGLILGPLGLALGGAIGGGIAAISSANKFHPVPVILRNLSPTEQEKLFKRIQYAFRNFGMQDVAGLTALILSQTALNELAFKEVKNFLTNDLSYTLGN